MQGGRMNVPFMMFPGLSITLTLAPSADQPEVPSDYAIVCHAHYREVGTLCKITFIEKIGVEVRVELSGLLRVHVDASFSDGTSTWTPILDNDDSLELFTEQELAKDRNELLVAFLAVISQYEDDEDKLELLFNVLNDTEDSLTDLTDLMVTYLFRYAGHEPVLIPFFYQILSDPDIVLRFQMTKFICTYVVGLLAWDELVADALAIDEPAEAGPIDAEASGEDGSGDGEPDES